MKIDWWGATCFREFKIKQDFCGRFNTWWSNFYQACCHKEGVFFSKELQKKMFRDKLWQKNSAEPVRNEQGQIFVWGKGVRGLDRNGVPKDLPQYIGQTRNLVKYSKFDNSVQRTQEPCQVQHFRCVTLADGTVKKTPLSIQNIERQERRLQNEYREKYGIRMKKPKVNESLSNEREEID